MEELKLYDIDSTELNELIANKRIELKQKIQNTRNLQIKFQRL